MTSSADVMHVWRFISYLQRGLIMYLLTKQVSSQALMAIYMDLVISPLTHPPSVPYDMIFS